MWRADHDDFPCQDNLQHLSEKIDLRGVAQSGQSPRFGAELSSVQITPSRPFKEVWC